LPVWIEKGGEHDRMHVTSLSNKQAASPDVLATCACNALHVRSGYGWLHLQLTWDRKSVHNGQLLSIFDFDRIRKSGADSDELFIRSQLNRYKGAYQLKSDAK